MDKKRRVISLSLILIVINSIIPYKINSPINYEKYNSNINSLNQNLNEDSINNDLIKLDSTDNWNNVDNSTIGNNFEIYSESNESIREFYLNNCDDWVLNNEFNFSDIRAEKIVNGDAESEDELWTDYLPPHYEGNVTRENNIPSGDIISDDYSWYFNLSTTDHAVIIGFDDPINVSSDSVIFSFSYSLLRNNLGMSYDSNICIRLFFQFDIYIFFWFNGNIGVLSNVTGPGGYADLLVNEATFNGVKHDYTLNITAIGLDLFNQKPDQLRSLAIQTWGELSSYQMEFLLDDLSLTDQKNPSSINLNVNSNPVLGEYGLGQVNFLEMQNSSIKYKINYTSQEKILFNYEYEIIGLSYIKSQRKCYFENWDTVKWNESTTNSLSYPIIINEFLIFKIIPIDWIVNQILIDGLPHTFLIYNLNGTHKKIELISNSYDKIEFVYYSNNFMSNLILSSYQITHNEKLSVSIESEIYSDELYLYIIGSNNVVYFTTSVNTNVMGDALITDIQLESFVPRGILTIYIFWNSDVYVGIGKRDFEITTYPTIILPFEQKIVTNYKQNFIVEIDYINIEIDDIIDSALIEYSWLFGSGVLQQNINKHYYVIISNIDTNPGNYYINITGIKNGYAIAQILIEIEVIFEDYNLITLFPENALPGEFLVLYSRVTDNFTQPVLNVKIRFEINNEPLSDTWTNDTGYAKITYQVSPIYQLNTINVSCSIIINEISFLTIDKTIFISISEIPQEVQLGYMVQNTVLETNETLFINYTINYPSFGKNWYCNLPLGFNVVSVRIITETTIIQANIFENTITWQRLVNETLSKNDIFALETLKPQVTTTHLTQKNEITIDITINSNFIQYKNLKIKIIRDINWKNYEQWNLYFQGNLITEQSDLIITSDYFVFNINTTHQDAYVIYQLIGIKNNIIQLSPTTIILGIGTLILTIISAILLLKKKSNVSLDIQV